MYGTEWLVKMDMLCIALYFLDLLSHLIRGYDRQVQDQISISTLVRKRSATWLSNAFVTHLGYKLSPLHSQPFDSYNSRPVPMSSHRWFAVLVARNCSPSFFSSSLCMYSLSSLFLSTCSTWREREMIPALTCAGQLSRLQERGGNNPPTLTLAIQGRNAVRGILIRPGPLRGTSWASCENSEWELPHTESDTRHWKHHSSCLEWITG